MDLCARRAWRVDREWRGTRGRRCAEIDGHVDADVAQRSRCRGHRVRPAGRVRMKAAGGRARSTSLTFKSITARPVVLKLERPLVARFGTLPDWTLILYDTAPTEVL